MHQKVIEKNEGWGQIWPQVAFWGLKNSRHNIFSFTFQACFLQEAQFSSFMLLPDHTAQYLSFRVVI
jgi:hypothetical protein